MNQLPAPLLSLGKAFLRQGTPLYFVGGMVRNSLLGLPASDLDVASAALPEEAAALARSLGFRADLANQRLGTVLIRGKGLHMEHTAFRRESYGPGGGHSPLVVTLGATLEEDARRRDFTVNAL